MSLQLFMLQVVEHDAWSGAKRNGYYGFLDQESAEAFIKDKYKDRKLDGPAPAYYVNYDIVGLVPCRADLVNEPEFKRDGRGYITVIKLKDLL